MQFRRERNRRKIFRLIFCILKRLDIHKISIDLTSSDFIGKMKFVKLFTKWACYR